MMKVLSATIVLITFCAILLAQVSSRNVVPASGDVAVAPAGDYEIGAGDVLSIDVWHEPEFEIKSAAVKIGRAHV